MFDGIALQREDIVIENHAPDGPLLGWKRLDGIKSVKQRVIGIAGVGPRVVPPVIDEKVDRLERVHAVPPVERNVDRVTRREFGDLRVFEGLCVKWESLEIGVVRVDDADGRPGWRQLERAEV